ncbi:MAG TPA: hypothetical protein VF516_44290 [Kofleriaceae bacterium]
MIRAGTVALIMLGLGACSNPARKETPLMNETQNATDDERLIARVRAAVEARVPAEGLAAFVGQGPLIDTTAGGSLLALQRIDFAPDPEHPDERIDRDKARAVVYWRRPVPGDDPRVVGVQIGDVGLARMFFAIILPPD